MDWKYELAQGRSWLAMSIGPKGRHYARRPLLLYWNLRGISRLMSAWNGSEGRRKTNVGGSKQGERPGTHAVVPQPTLAPTGAVEPNSHP
jgi:hypothetical protein